MSSSPLPLPPDPTDYEAYPEPSAARILLVEDDPDSTAFVRVILESDGPFSDVVNVADGEEGLRVAAESHFDLIITGVMMPGMTGLELVSQLRARPGTATSPIIILSAKALATDRALGFAAGADDYMAKPFDPDELLARVRALLRRGRAKDSLPPAPS